MNYRQSWTGPFGNNPCGCGVRSIDYVTGKPSEDYIISVFKGSTLTTEFQFPFNLDLNDIVSIVYGDPIELNDAVITRISENTVSVTWAANIIDILDSDANSFRVSVEREDGTIKNYNEIKIRVV